MSIPDEPVTPELAVTPAVSAAAPRSRFITSLAWTFIVLAGMTTCSSLLQNMVLNVLMSTVDVKQTLREAGIYDTLPAFMHTLLDHLRTYLATVLASSLITLYCSIRLLQRRNWARWVFIVLMALGLVANLAAMAMPAFMPALMPALPPATAAGAPDDFTESFGSLLKVMSWVVVVAGAAFSLLHGWIIWRLMSPAVQREFQSGAEG